MKTKLAIIFLIFLAPLAAEFFSATTPFFHFFKPGILLLYLGLYGLGALIIREISAHKKLGYVSILLFGAAYGVLEEGLILKSWFDPTWMGGAITSDVLRVWGFSVLQPFANVAYHAVISITAPILLINALARSREAWLSKKQLLIPAVLFLAASLIIALTFNADYQVRPWHYWLSLITLAVFFALGWRGIKIKLGTKNYSPLKIFLVALPFLFLQFFIFYRLSLAKSPWYVIIGLALLLYFLYARFYSRINWGESYQKYYAAAAGFISGLLPIAYIVSRSTPAKQLNLVGLIIFLIFLFIGYRKVSPKKYSQSYEGKH